jgi:hypothetical protein
MSWEREVTATTPNPLCSRVTAIMSRTGIVVIHQQDAGHDGLFKRNHARKWNNGSFGWGHRGTSPHAQC